MRKLMWPLAVALFVTCGPVAAQPVVSYTKSPAKFEDVRDDLKNAIEAKGLVIDYHAQIGRMLDRTGGDVGSTKRLYVDAQAFQFCSAQLSRKTMEANPSNVVMCPYTIVVYAVAGKPNEVIVAYRRPMKPGGGPASHSSLGEVDALLDKLAREAVGRK